MTTVELTNTQPPLGEPAGDLKKPLDSTMPSSVKDQLNQSQQPSSQEKNQHPLHQFDLTKMSKFYEACVGKFKEQNPTWHPTEWANKKPSENPHNNPQAGPNPLVLSLKQHVYEAFHRLAKESGEPMIIMPNFDYGDIFNFVRFLQNLKSDGINSIGKYKNYLNNKDMRKFEVDLVVIHPKFGIMLFEIKDCDHLDNKRRIRAKAQLTNARSCFDSIARLLVEAKGWTQSEAKIPITEFIALPNVLERPEPKIPSAHLQTPGGNQNHSATSTTSVGKHSPRQLNYLIRSDLESPTEFAKWWSKFVAEPMVQQQQNMEAENKTNKFDLSIMNWMTGLLNSIRNNTIMPVVYPETGDFSETLCLPEDKQSEQPKPQEPKPETEKPVDQQQSGEPEKTPSENKPTDESAPTQPPKEALQFQPALNVYAEFFQKEHESVRSSSKVVVSSMDAECIRKTICLQTLWLLLNDSQKKISVVCSEMNKPYYEEFFTRQRKLYNNLNNLRFYTDVQSCTINSQNTLKKDGEIWFFDSGIKGTMGEVLERVKNLNAFWVFTTDEESFNKCKSELENPNVKYIKLGEAHKQLTDLEKETMPWISGGSLKLPMRLHCDLLVIGDIVGVNQVNLLYRYLKTSHITNHTGHQNHQNGSYHQYHPQQQQLNFNPAKKFKTIKFIRGGTIDNLRTSLKMHDSIQAQVVLMHVGDEDLFKNRNSSSTIERIKELATLVKEYCPKSFVVLSTLMRRMSRTENGVISEVNKGVVSFCKTTRDTSNFYHMLNTHFEPDYHTQEGRVLSSKGLKLYTDNLLFMVDNFLIRNNKQH